jgi:hypothetical protein
MKTTNLDQSKKLKAIGAPQETAFGYYNGDLLNLSSDVESRKYYNLVAKTCAAYTLDELIEWLGDDFQMLARMRKEDTYRWGAQSTKKKTAKGDTPLEAVYNLAVALREKGEKATDDFDSQPVGSTVAPIMDTNGDQIGFDVLSTPTSLNTEE